MDFSRLTDMVATKKVKSTKNIAVIFINKNIEYRYLYGSWVKTIDGIEDSHGRVRTYDKFVEMVKKEYPIDTVDSFIIKD